MSEQLLLISLWVRNVGAMKSEVDNRNDKKVTPRMERYGMEEKLSSPPHLISSHHCLPATILRRLERPTYKILLPVTWAIT